MNKTVTITLQGVVFTLEEQAYAELAGYLDAIQAQFGPENQDVIQEIELRIAEIFQEQFLKDKTVITEADIAALKEIMGEVHDFADEEPPKQTKKQAKRFYRDGEDKIIAGVASGIGAYFNIDPTIVRIAMVIALVTGVFSGAVIVMYLVLWMITDEADTLTERMEMRGEPVTIESIKRKANEAVESGKAFVEKKAHSKEAKDSKKKVKGFFEQLFSAFGRVFWKIIKVLQALAIAISKIIGVAFLIGGTIGISAALFAAGMFLFFPDSAHHNLGFELLGSNIDYTILTASAALVALIPLLFLFIFGFRLLKTKFVFPLSAFVILLLLWGAAIASTALFAVKMIPEVRRHLEIEEYVSLDVENATSTPTDTSMSPGETSSTRESSGT